MNGMVHQYPAVKTTKTVSDGKGNQRFETQEKRFKAEIKVAKSWYNETFSNYKLVQLYWTEALEFE